MKTSGLLALLLAILWVSVPAVPQESGGPIRVAFEIVVPKITYHQNEPIVLKMLLTNRGERPVMVERSEPLCSDTFFAFVHLEVRDAHGREAQKVACDAQSASGEAFEAEVISGMKDGWIELKPGDVFGWEVTPRVRKMKGVYTIRASYIPAKFHNNARSEIARRGLNIVAGIVEASPVKIDIR